MPDLDSALREAIDATAAATATTPFRAVRARRRRRDRFRVAGVALAVAAIAVTAVAVLPGAGSGPDRAAGSVEPTRSDGAAGPTEPTRPPTDRGVVRATFDRIGPYPGPRWQRDGRAVRRAEITAAAGPEHCAWQSVTFLSVGWPLGTAAESYEQIRQYLRDPYGVLTFAPEVRRGFRARAVLPADARPTGYRTGGVELWLAPSDQDSAAYLVNAADHRDVERWPRPARVVACA